MKLSHFRPALYALICSAGFLQAKEDPLVLKDEVTLKDGTKLLGEIRSETPDAIKIRYQMKPGSKIIDEKDVRRSEIVDILRRKPETVKLNELKEMGKMKNPLPDLMGANAYETIISDYLRPFVNHYPGTPEAAEVEKMIVVAQEEKEKVLAGGMKVEGKWLTPDEAKADSYNIKAYGVYVEILEKVEAKDYVAALRAFDKMANYQSGSVASIYYPKAVEAINEVLVKYEAQIEQMIKDQPALQRMRDEGIKKLVEPDLSRMKDAILRENEQWKDGYDAERKSNTRWFTPYKYDLPSLKTLAKTIVDEKTRLKAVDTVVIGKINQAIADIMRSEASAGKDGEALKKMGEAILTGEAAAGGADATSRQFYSTVFQGYRQRYAYAQQQLAAKSMQQTQAGSVPGAVGGSTAVAGTGTPGMDDRVAAALAAASGGAAPAVAPAAGAAPAVAPGAMPAPAPTPGVVVPGAQPVVQPAVAAPTGVAPAVPSYAQPQQAAPMSIQPPVEESAGISTNTLILIGIGVVVLVLVVAMSGGKKKK